MEKDMEYWDLYDENRKPLGRTHVRGEPFAEGEFYVSCEIWIKDSKGNFLITKRHPNKKTGNLWEFVGGGTLAGETTLHSAVRELKEETGISVDESELQLLTTYSHKNYFLDIFILKKDIPLESVILEPDEVIDVKWASDGLIQQMIKNEEFVYSVEVRYGMYGKIARDF